MYDSIDLLIRIKKESIDYIYIYIFTMLVVAYFIYLFFREVAFYFWSYILLKEKKNLDLLGNIVMYFMILMYFNYG